ncbi:MAG: DegT/DnrJ/EryC1/StrS family aminotransferase [Chloroflexota bacterium]
MGLQLAGSPTSRQQHGLAQLEELDALLAKRHAMAARYDAALAGSRARPAVHAPWASPSYWLYTSLLATPDAQRRDAVLDRLSAAGIDARPMDPAAPDAPARRRPATGGAVADEIFARAISLPSSASLGRTP